MLAVSSVDASTTLIVSGLGMVSSLGLTVETSCASARAGLVRTTPIMDVRFADPAGGEEVPLSAHVVWGLGEGYGGLGRLARLGSMALRQVIDDVLAVGDWSRAALILVLNNDWHINEAAKRAVESGEADAEIIESTAARVKFSQDIVRQNLLDRMMRMIGLAELPRYSRIVFGDEATIVLALKEATRLMREDRVTNVFLGAINSQIFLEALQAYRALGLLKGPENSSGFAPGEMAVFIVLRSMGSATFRTASLTISAPSVAKEPSSLFQDGSSTGEALATCISRVLAAPGSNQPCRLVIGNQTGDDFRARDWGAALCRLKSIHSDIVDLPEWSPASHFGDVGVASGLAAVSLAAQGLARGYAAAAPVLLWLLSESGTRGAFRVAPLRH
jgi:3-oxoacyl-[acyl-carrier-protein] synthase-1